MTLNMTAPVLIEPYNPQWKTDFDALQMVFSAHLNEWLTGIEHVGSTSVVGLAAKPILDMNLVVSDPDKLPFLVVALGKLGYRHEGDKGIPGREAFRQTNRQAPTDGSGRTWPQQHLYVCVAGNPALREHLLFRNYLRQHPITAAAYAALKYELADQFRDNRLAYTEGKTAFIREVLAKATL